MNSNFSDERPGERPRLYVGRLFHLDSAKETMECKGYLTARGRTPRSHELHARSARHDLHVEEASAPTAGTPTAIAWATASAHPRAHDAVARRPRSARSRALHGARASRSRPARSAHARTPRCAPGSWNIAEPVVIQVYITCTHEMNTTCWFFNFYSTWYQRPHDPPSSTRSAPSPLLPLFLPLPLLPWLTLQLAPLLPPTMATSTTLLLLNQPRPPSFRR